MSYMKYDGETPIPVFQSYNDKIIKKLKHIKNGTIFTSSQQEQDPREAFEQTVEYHLDKLD